MSQTRPHTNPDALPSVSILGAGAIGCSMALLFAQSGHRVTVFDPNPAQREPAMERIAQRLADLGDFDLLDEPARDVLSRIGWSGSIGEAVRDADFVHECGPEDAAIKRDIFEEIDRHVPASAIIASATSAMPISTFAGGLGISRQCLVAHPANPAYLLRVIELVPGPATDAKAIARARAILEGAGLGTVLIHREIEGFVFNRLQGAILREAYCLVRDGVTSVEDIDRIVRDGLGLRWSVVGPFETVDLNTTGGIVEHARRLGPAYARMGAERGQDDPWTSDLVEEVDRQRRTLLPLDEHEARVAWRDRQMMVLLAARQAAKARSRPNE